MTDSIDDVYHEALLEEVRHPSHAGTMSEADVVLQGTNASCGDMVTIYLTFEVANDLQSRIMEMTWVGSGCVISQAAASTLARLIAQRKLTLAEARALSQAELEHELGLKDISVSRIKCLLLAVNTLKQKR